MTFEHLTHSQVDLANRTMSGNAFYYVVGSAIAQRQSLSVVRMGDGEVRLFDESAAAIADGRGDSLVQSFWPEWRTRMGIEGMTYTHINASMQRAIDDCTYYGPNVNGLVNKVFSLYSHVSPTTQLVDNFFVNQWNDEQKIELYKAAGHVLFIHGNRSTADAIQKRLKQYLGVKLTYIELNKWDQAYDVVEQASKLDTPLVMFSGGPASKWIGPAIAKLRPAVVLDIGNAADYWTLANYKHVTS